MGRTIYLLRSKYSREDPSSRLVDTNNDPMIKIDYSSGGTGVDVGSFVTHQYQKKKKKRTPDARKMLLPYVLLLLPVFVATQESQSMNTLDREILRNDGSKDALDWIGESFLNAVDALFPGSKLYGSVEEDRKTKTRLGRYIIPLIIGFILIKSILLPLTLKTLAVLSGKAVVLSMMSLILAAIVGLKKVANEAGYDINKYRRQDKYDNVQEFEPYSVVYKERRKKK